MSVSDPATVEHSGSGWIARYAAGFAFPGVVAAGLFFAMSLAPSLIPRVATTQGLLSGVSAATGFWIGLVGIVAASVAMFVGIGPFKGWGDQGVIAGIVLLTLGPIGWRIHCELLFVVFAILDRLTEIRNAARAWKVDRGYRS